MGGRSGARRETAWLAAVTVGLAVVGGVVPALVARRYGALAIPRSDDWSYLHTLFTWQRTGRWDFNAWVSMTLVGQVLAARPVVEIFGRSIVAVSLLGAALGLVGLLAVVGLGRVLLRARGWAALVAAVVAVGPLWGPLAPTFMTDVPAFACEMVALAIACVALGRRPISLPLLTLAVAAGFAGISIRQYAVVPVIAILVAAAWALRADGDRRRRRAVGLLAATVAGATVALFAWWSTIHDGKALTPEAPTGESIRLAIGSAAGFVRLAGLMLLPVVLLADPVGIARRAWDCGRDLAVGLFVGTTALLVLGYVADSRRPFVGNYFDRRGVLSDDIIPGTRPLIMPTAAFDVLVVVGSVAALVLVLAAVPFLAERTAELRARRLTRPDPRVAALGLSVVGFAVMYEVAIAFGLPIFDRYALPALPLVGVLLLRSVEHRRGEAATPTRRAPAWAAAGLLVLAALGIAYTAESASFDGTRWKVAEAAVRAGYPVLSVDDGYEWVGWFRGRGPRTAATVIERRHLRKSYFSGLCVSVVINPPDPFSNRVVAAALSHAPTRKPVWVLALRNKRRCGPPAPGERGAFVETGPSGTPSRVAQP